MARRLWVLLFALIGSLGAFAVAAGAPTEAQVALQQALLAAKTDPRPVLLVFGAGWCPNCRALNRSLKTGRNSALMAREFKIVSVDVGNFDRNLDLAKAYGNPIEKGIPSVVVLSADNRILYSTKAGELTDAQHMGDAAVHDFFVGVARAAQTRP